MRKATPKYTVYLEDKDGTVLTDCTEMYLSTNGGLSFVNKDGEPCWTTVPFFARMEAPVEKP